MQKQPPEVFCKNRYLASSFTKKEALAQVFSCEFCEILKNTFFTENLWTIASSYDSLRRLLKGQKYDGMNQSRSKQ